jgi:hypothetical protein
LKTVPGCLPRGRRRVGHVKLLGVHAHGHPLPYAHALQYDLQYEFIANLELVGILWYPSRLIGIEQFRAYTVEESLGDTNFVKKGHILDLRQASMARCIHGLPKVSPRPATPDPSTPFMRATPKTALHLFLVWPAHGAGGLWPSSTFLDTPRHMGLASQKVPHVLR